jgi:hypothetical protein
MKLQRGVLRVLMVGGALILPAAGLTALSVGTAAAATPHYSVGAHFTFTLNSGANKSTAACGPLTVTFSGSNTSTSRHNTTTPTMTCSTSGSLPTTTHTATPSSGSVKVLATDMVATKTANRTKGSLTLSDVHYTLSKVVTTCVIAFSTPIVGTGTATKHHQSFVTGSYNTASHVTVTPNTMSHAFCHLVNTKLQKATAKFAATFTVAATLF